MDAEDIVNVKISNRCRMKLIDEVFYSLDDKYQDLFTNSCFGRLLSLRNIKLASQLFHQLILRSTSTSKENEVFIKVGDKLARFGLQEFILVTGLKVGDLENEDPKLGQNSRLVKERFKRSNSKIKRDDELLKPFWKEFGPFDDEADPKLDNVLLRMKVKKNLRVTMLNQVLLAHNVLRHRIDHLCLAIYIHPR
ncbi:Hypothetical predicted protein [Olea europaea subsp. europaea]|uniref:Uncharacterized protein n=1 Tax=Olea europaea subsp. europaea TaxID=158383 RepID=A0A8S0V4U1_OLEEU|nr:Hypothetical predicted protein [Olea europaea subsp. europaea]